MLEELCDGLEESTGVLRTREGFPAFAAQLGEQPRQLAPPRHIETGPGHLGHDPVAAERVGPGSEGQDRRALVRLAEEDAGAPLHRRGRELHQEPALAEAGLAHRQDQASTVAWYLVQGSDEE